MFDSIVAPLPAAVKRNRLPPEAKICKFERKWTSHYFDELPDLMGSDLKSHPTGSLPAHIWWEEATTHLYVRMSAPCFTGCYTDNCVCLSEFSEYLYLYLTIF